MCAAPLMPFPPHEPVAADAMAAELQGILERQPLRRVWVRRDAQAHPGVHGASPTRVPFLILLLAGRARLPQGLRPADALSQHLRPGDAVWFAPDAFCNFHQRQVGAYLRITFERDLTLVALSERRRTIRRPENPNFFRIRACVLPQGVPLEKLVAATPLTNARATERADTALRVRQAIDAVLLSVVDQLRAQATPPGNPDAALWTRIHAYLRENHRAPINRETTAAAFAISPTRLSRLSRRWDGRKFQRVLEDLRLAEAVWLLTHTVRPIADVAAQSGFSSAPYFHEVFRRTQGQTPSAYRSRSTP